MSIASWHKKSSYDTFFHCIIGGLFFLLSVFTGLVQFQAVFYTVLFYFTSSAVRKPFLTRRLFILSFGSRSLLTEVSWLRVSIT